MSEDQPSNQQPVGGEGSANAEEPKPGAGATGNADPKANGQVSTPEAKGKTAMYGEFGNDAQKVYKSYLDLRKDHTKKSQELAELKKGKVSTEVEGEKGKVIEIKNIVKELFKTDEQSPISSGKSKEEITSTYQKALDEGKTPEEAMGMVLSDVSAAAENTARTAASIESQRITAEEKLDKFLTDEKNAPFLPGFLNLLQRNPTIWKTLRKTSPLFATELMIIGSLGLSADIIAKSARDEISNRGAEPEPVVEIAPAGASSPPEDASPAPADPSTTLIGGMIKASGKIAP